MIEKKPSQHCPICGSAQPLAARICSICGAKLPGERSRATANILAVEEPETPVRYDPAEGDDDLYVGDLSPRIWRMMLFVAVLLALLAGIGLGIGITRLGDDDGDANDGARVEMQAGEPAPGQTGNASPTIPPTATMREVSPTPSASRTPRAVAPLSTITPAPPTATETPTPGPCLQTAQSGDTVFGMAARCGHRDMAIVDVILDINDMKSATELQINQTLEIPWPTPTGGAPTDVPAAETGAIIDGDGSPDATEVVYLNEFGTPDALAKYQNMEPTLRPGQAWHTVQAGETILAIAVQYDTTIETLSQINPEVPFLQCDYGMASGGPNCSVMLYPEQRLRVPVPLPTETPIPTPVGTLTPTPTATPTFNAPYLLMPEDKARFLADQMVTLRWGGTAKLEPGERYLVHVRDRDTGEIYMALVNDTTYILPGGWQPSDRNRHTLEWQISIATIDDQYNILNEDHQTESRTFTWDSR